MFHPTGEIPWESDKLIRVEFEHSPREMHFSSCLIELLNFSLQEAQEQTQKGQSPIEGKELYSQLTNVVDGMVG